MRAAPRPPVLSALLIVDVQGTFADDFPGAGLPVPGSGATVPGIREFTLAAARLPGVVKVVTSQDWHPPRLPGHMAEPHEEPDHAQKRFPRHGVAGTAEADLHPQFASPDVLAVVTDQVRKGQSAAAFSAFEGADESGRTLEDILRRAGVERVVVIGWELANCVAASARSARGAGFEVWVVSGLCSVLEPDALPDTVASLKGEGVRVVDSPAAALSALASEASAEAIE